MRGDPAFVGRCLRTVIARWPIRAFLALEHLRKGHGLERPPEELSGFIAQVERAQCNPVVHEALACALEDEPKGPAICLIPREG